VKDLEEGLGLEPVRSVAFADGRLVYVLWRPRATPAPGSSSSPQRSSTRASRGDLRRAADGTGLRRVAAGAVASWSPDRRRLAFVHTGRVYVIAGGGSGQHYVGVGGAPSWSRDGQRLACSDYDRVVIADASGSGAPRPLRNSRLRIRQDCVWSPDGQRIAFAVSQATSMVATAARAPLDLVLFNRGLA
jgi:Tol biopolymer transport system component